MGFQLKLTFDPGKLPFCSTIYKKPGEACMNSMNWDALEILITSRELEWYHWADHKGWPARISTHSTALQRRGGPEVCQAPLLVNSVF